MQKFTTTVTQRGQVTVPAQVRKVLGVKPKDKITFTIDDDAVRLSSAAFTLESAFGSVHPLHRPEDLEKLSRIAKEEKAEETVRILKRR